MHYRLFTRDDLGVLRTRAEWRGWIILAVGVRGFEGIVEFIAPGPLEAEAAPEGRLVAVGSGQPDSAAEWAPSWRRIALPWRRRGRNSYDYSLPRY